MSSMSREGNCSESMPLKLTLIIHEIYAKHKKQLVAVQKGAAYGVLLLSNIDC